MAAYSFLDTSCSISGPNISATIGGNGTGSAEEGFTVVFEEDANVMTQGADGSVMLSLTAAKRGRIELHLLKDSPINALLSNAYNADRSNGSQQWGQNTINIRDTVSGDSYQCTNCAFRKFPDNAYQTRGNILNWVLDASVINPILGSLTVQ